MRIFNSSEKLRIELLLVIMLKGNDKMVKRKMGGERTMLMLPFNVIMVAKIVGQIDSCFFILIDNSRFNFLSKERLLHHMLMLVSDKLRF